jgi:hypothetical protein
MKIVEVRKRQFAAHQQRNSRPVERIDLRPDWRQFTVDQIK